MGPAAASMEEIINSLISSHVTTWPDELPPGRERRQGSGAAPFTRISWKPNTAAWHPWRISRPRMTSFEEAAILALNSPFSWGPSDSRQRFLAGAYQTARAKGRSAASPYTDPHWGLVTLMVKPVGPEAFEAVSRGHGP